MASFSDWGAIHKEVSNQVKNCENIWDTSFSVDILLPNLMRAELRQVLTNRNTSKEPPRILESWLENIDRRENILSNFGEEMAMFLIADEQ
jgi:predicted nucleic acid-binding protein